MCEIIGIVNYKESLIERKEILEKMLILDKNENSEIGLYINKNAIFGHKKLKCAINVENDNQPMSYTIGENTYTIVFDGKLYNSKELITILKENGFDFKSCSDTEVLLKSFVYYGKSVCKYLNGIFAFAIWNEKKRELFLARDHFGIKPLYYTIKNGNFIFASEIKSILKYPDFEVVLDKNGISELFAIGPAHTSGKTPLKNIFELESAQFLVLNDKEYYRKEYWKLETKYHTDDLETTCEKIRSLIVDSTKRQLISNKPLGILLSGGLDSSIITLIASEYYKEEGKILETFSVDYKDNDKNFIKSDFQPSRDDYYINLISEKFKTKHTRIEIDTPELFEGLKDAVFARDFPGMADVDASYFLFFKKLKEHTAVAISGECSDEIFGGYPWYFRDDTLNANTFPWSIALDERQKLLNQEISKKINIKEYVNERYNESIKKVKCLDEESKETSLHRKLIYLTSNWFMPTLLDRTDRMSRKNGIEVRVPFCDYRIVEYVWNIPWEMKAYKGREKGLLRKSMEGYLPDEVIYRKKSPYPKTYDPNYTQKVKESLSKIMDNKNANITKLLNKDYIMDILNTEGKSFVRPWFGQLMTGPQLMAYLIQVEFWLEKYHPKIEI